MRTILPRQRVVYASNSTLLASSQLAAPWLPTPGTTRATSKRTLRQSSDQGVGTRQRKATLEGSAPLSWTHVMDPESAARSHSMLRTCDTPALARSPSKMMTQPCADASTASQTAICVACIATKTPGYASLEEPCARRPAPIVIITATRRGRRPAFLPAKPRRTVAPGSAVAVFGSPRPSVLRRPAWLTRAA